MHPSQLGGTGGGHPAYNSSCDTEDGCVSSRRVDRVMLLRDTRYVPAPSTARTYFDHERVCTSAKRALARTGGGLSHVHKSTLCNSWQYTAVCEARSTICIISSPYTNETHGKGWWVVSSEISRVYVGWGVWCTPHTRGLLAGSSHSPGRCVQM